MFTCPYCGYTHRPPQYPCPECGPEPEAYTDSYDSYDNPERI